MNVAALKHLDEAGSICESDKDYVGLIHGDWCRFVSKQELFRGCARLLRTTCCNYVVGWRSNPRRSPSPCAPFMSTLLNFQCP